MTKQDAESTSTTVTTPSGLEVRYTSAPKRMYEVRVGDRSFETFREDGQDDFVSNPATEWREVPSVTTVLGVLDKPGLPWWGMKVGVAGVLGLHQRGLVREVVDPVQNVFACQGPLQPDGASYWVAAGEEQLIALLTQQKLTVNHVRDNAGQRGSAVHDAFELWCKDGTVPDPEMFPPEERGYVEGLLAFLGDVHPAAEAAEVQVGSVEHGFAGRYDVRFRVPEECQVVYHRTPKKGAHYATLAPGVYLGDLKTSAGVYQTSHGRQLEAYELASVECGYEPTDARGIIHVNRDGGYEFVRSRATAEHFLAVLQVWRDNEVIHGPRRSK